MGTLLFSTVYELFYHFLKASHFPLLQPSCRNWLISLFCLQYLKPFASAIGLHFIANNSDISYNFSCWSFFIVWVRKISLVKYCWLYHQSTTWSKAVSNNKKASINLLEVCGTFHCIFEQKSPCLCTVALNYWQCCRAAKHFHPNHNSVIWVKSVCISPTIAGIWDSKIPPAFI